MEGNQNRRRWETPKTPTHAWLVARLDESRERVLEVFEAMTDESLTRPCADDWTPLDDDCVVEGPLDALWFALQVVRHTAYHLGQLNAYRLVLEALQTE